MIELGDRVFYRVGGTDERPMFCAAFVIDAVGDEATLFVFARDGRTDTVTSRRGAQVGQFWTEADRGLTSMQRDRFRQVQPPRPP